MIKPQLKKSYLCLKENQPLTLLREVESILQQENTSPEVVQPMSEQEMDQFLMEVVLADNNPEENPGTSNQTSGDEPEANPPKSNQVCYCV